MLKIFQLSLLMKIEVINKMSFVKGQLFIFLLFLLIKNLPAMGSGYVKQNDIFNVIFDNVDQNILIRITLMQDVHFIRSIDRLNQKNERKIKFKLQALKSGTYHVDENSEVRKDIEGMSIVIKDFSIKINVP